MNKIQPYQIHDQKIKPRIHFVYESYFRKFWKDKYEINSNEISQQKKRPKRQENIFQNIIKERTYEMQSKFSKNVVQNAADQSNFFNFEQKNNSQYDKNISWSQSAILDKYSQLGSNTSSIHFDNLNLSKKIDHIFNRSNEIETIPETKINNNIQKHLSTISQKQKDSISKKSISELKDPVKKISTQNLEINGLKKQTDIINKTFQSQVKVIKSNFYEIMKAKQQNTSLQLKKQSNNNITSQKEEIVKKNNRIAQDKKIQEKVVQIIFKDNVSSKTSSQNLSNQSTNIPKNSKLTSQQIINQSDHDTKQQGKVFSQQCSSTQIEANSTKQQKRVSQSISAEHTQQTLLSKQQSINKNILGIQQLNKQQVIGQSCVSLQTPQWQTEEIKQQIQQKYKNQQQIIKEQSVGLVIKRSIQVQTQIQNENRLQKQLVQTQSQLRLLKQIVTKLLHKLQEKQLLEQLNKQQII